MRATTDAEGESRVRRRVPGASFRAALQAFRGAPLALAALVAIVSACEPEPDARSGSDNRPSASPGDRGGGMGGGMGGMMDRMMERPPSEAMQGMMEMMGNMPEGVAATKLPDPDSRGARLAARYCSQCHGLPSPSRLSADEWSSTARRMFARMEHMEGMGGRMRMMMGDVSAPSAGEERIMVDYLRDHALRTVSADELPAADLPGAPLFARSCSRCHALPDPSLHEPDEWPTVVERMRRNMRTMEVAELSDEDARRIVEYLRAVSTR